MHKANYVDRDGQMPRIGSICSHILATAISSFEPGKVLCLDIPTNPLAILTFISAPAVLTNASCVLLFGTGNRYGRAIDRVHALADLIDRVNVRDENELHLRVRQLEAGEMRTMLIVRALTCFYVAVAGFAASTLISLVGAIVVAGGQRVSLSFAVAFVAGALGVSAMIAGSAMLARETTYSFRILRDEKRFLEQRVRERIADRTAQSRTLKN